MPGSSTTINGTAGGLFQDVAGSTVFDLGSQPASVLAGLGTDTILGGSGALAVYAADDLSNLDVQGGTGPLSISLLDLDAALAGGNATISGGSAGETVTGGYGNILIAQAGALTLHPANGTIDITANGQAITVWASDNSGYEVFTPTAGSTVIVAPTPDGYGHTEVFIGNSQTVALGQGFETIGSALHYLTGASSSTFGNAIIPNPAAPVVTGLTPATDTGVSDTDGTTDDMMPAFAGTAVAGDQVVLYMDGYAELGTSAANAQGIWTIATHATIAEGNHSITAEAIDISGVQSNVSNPYTIDITTAGPSNPTIIGLDPSTDSGTTGDGTTNTRNVEIDGTSDPNDTIILYDSATSIGSGVANSSGTWSVTSTVALTDGSHNLTAVATDVGGETSAASNIVVVTIQTTPPLAPTNLALDPASDSGIHGDDLTNVTTPTIDGAALPDELVRVGVDGTNLGTVTADADGDWSYTITSQLSTGTHTVTANAVDDVGNISTAATLDLTIETSASAPTITAAVAFNTGTVTASHLTNAGTITISGIAAAGATIVVADNIVTIPGSIVANGSGYWSDQVTLSQGTNSLTAIVSSDAAGNASTPSLPFVLSASLTAPTAPSILGITSATDSGTKGDHVTDDIPATYTGTGTVGDIVALAEIGSGSIVLGTATVAANGTWFVSGSIASGAATLVATQTDALGNVSSDSAPYVVNIVAAPAAPALSLTGGNTTSSLTPTITVTDTGQGTTNLYDNAASIGTLATSGTLFTPTNGLFVGLNTITAIFTDQYGDVSNATGITIDVTGTPTTLTLDPGSDSGIPGDGITKVSRPQIDGTAVDNASIVILDNGGTIGNATANAGGAWTFTPPAALPAGANTLSAVAELGGSGSIVSAPLVLTIETVVAAPIITSIFAASGTITANDLTNAGTITLSGTAAQGATIAILDGTATVGTVVANGSVAWTDNVALFLGENTLSAMILYDVAGNSSPASAAVVIDAFPAAPAAPSILGLAPGSQSGTAGNSRTDITTPTLIGTGTAGEVVTLLNGNTVVATGTVGGNGTWTATIATALPIAATSTLTATVTDIFGTVSNRSAAYDLMIDAKPAQPSIALAAAGSLSATARPVFVISSADALADSFTIYDNGNQIGDLPAPQQSSPTDYTPSASLTVGLNTIVAVASNSYGDISNAGTVVITVQPPAPTLDPGSDSGIAGDNITNVGKPQIDGTGVAYANIVILDNGSSIGATTANSSGNWTFTPSNTLALGSNTLIAMVPLSNNQTVASLPLNLMIQTAAPAPSITAAVAANPGTVTTAGLTNAGTITLTGTAEQGATIVVVDNGLVQAGNAVVGTNGTWSETVIVQQGFNTLAAEVSNDNAGNSSAFSAPFVLVAYPTAPGSPSIAGLATADTGGQAGALTAVLTPTLIGTGLPADTISLLLGSNVVGTGTVASNGTWAVAMTAPLTLGQNVITAEQSDPFGRTSTVSSGYGVTLEPISAPSLDAGSQSGSSNSITNVLTPRIDGVATPNATIVLLDNGGTIGHATANASGNWSISPGSPLVTGGNSLVAVASVSNGVTVASSPFILTIQTSTAAPTITLNPSSDSGVVGDNLTNVTMPTLIGTAAPGASISLSDNGTLMAAVTANAQGAWSYTPTAALPTGANLVTGTATDVAGNISHAGSLSLTIETSVAAPTILSFTPNTGGFNNDTSASIITLVGTAAAGSAVVIYDNSVELGEVSTISGQWTFSADPSIGTNSYTAEIASDPAGNASSLSAAYIVTRLTPPVAPTVNGLAAGSDSGIAGDGITNVTRPTLIGLGPAGDVVNLLNAGTVLATGTVSTGGTWSVTPATTLAAGSYTVTATVTDPANSVSPASGAYQFIIDTTPPQPPTVTLAPISVNTVLGAFKTDARMPSFIGTATANDAVKVYDGGTLLGAVTASAQGTWSYTPVLQLPIGTQEVSAVVTDAAGNASGAGVLELTIINAPTTAPTIALAAASNSNTAGNQITNVTTPELTGSAAIGDRVVIYSNGSAVATVTASAADIWTYTFATPLADGTYVLQAAATDPVLNTTTTSSAYTLQIDTAAPMVPIIQGVSGGVTNNGTTVIDESDPTITGSGTAGGLITLLNNGTVLATTTAAADGSWSLQPSAALNSGNYLLTAEATDTVGNVSAQSAPFAVSVELPQVLDASLQSPLLGAAMPTLVQIFGASWSVSDPTDVTYYTPNQTPPTAAAGAMLALDVGDANDNSIVTVPAGTDIVSTTADQPVTLVGGGNNQLILSAGSNTTYEASGGSGVYFANQAVNGTADGNNQVFLEPGTGNYAVDTESGNNTIEALSGNDTIAGGDGSNQIFLGSGNDSVLATGSDMVSCDTVAGGSDTVYAGSDPHTIEVFVNASKLTFYGGQGNAVIVGGGSAGDQAPTVFGWGGSDTIFGSLAGGEYFGGDSGNNDLVASAGTGSTTLAGGKGGNNLLVAQNSANDTLMAGSGDETLFGKYATGNNTYFSGSGNNTIQTGEGNDTVIMASGNSTVWAGTGSTLVWANTSGEVVANTGQQTLMGGSASELYTFLNSQAGGDTFINGYNPALDQILLSGYSSSDLSTALANQTSFAGGTSISFADGTRITFVGIQHVDGSNFTF